MSAAARAALFSSTRIDASGLMASNPHPSSLGGAPPSVRLPDWLAAGGQTGARSGDVTAGRRAEASAFVSPGAAARLL